MYRLRIVCCLVVLAGCEPERVGPTPITGAAFGRFEGEVNVTWLEDRDMRLNEDFIYIDPRGKRWLAPAGSVVNGASIPKVFWSATGGPFSGKFRNASVVHDVACRTRTETWEDVHRQFYEACRCGGVGEKKAKLLYWSVYHYGPRWDVGGDPNKITGAGPSNMPGPNESIVTEAKQYFQENNPSLEEIQNLSFEK